jgi:hypothetical protein
VKRRKPKTRKRRGPAGFAIVRELLTLRASVVTLGEQVDALRASVMFPRRKAWVAVLIVGEQLDSAAPVCMSRGHWLGHGEAWDFFFDPQRPVRKLTVLALGPATIERIVTGDRLQGVLSGGDLGPWAFIDETLLVCVRLNVRLRAEIPEQ